MLMTRRLKTDRGKVVILKPRSRLSGVLWMALKLVLATGVLLALFIPYPYQTGGPFRFLPVQSRDLRVELEGMVEAVFVEEGQRVEAGQPLARLVKRVQQRNLDATVAQLDQKKAELDLLLAGPKPEEVEKARMTVEVAEAHLAWSRPRAERHRDLYRQQLVSQQELENAIQTSDIDARELEEVKAQLRLVESGARAETIDGLKAEIRSTEAIQRNYGEDLERTVLVSPIKGQITTPWPQELVGQYLKPGQRDLVLQVEDAEVIRAEVEVPEEVAAGIVVGADVKIVPWTYHDQVFTGHVASVAPVASTNTTTRYGTTIEGEQVNADRLSLSSSTWKIVRVLTEIPNPDGLLKSEMTGYAKIAVEDRPVWDVLFRPLIRWFMVQVWYWIP